jgi:regulator of protease activity HflC (stomatin/prohibitin superfamily)
MKYEDGKEITGVGDLQTEAQDNLNEIFFGKQKPASEIKELEEGTPAKRILDEFGVFIKQILIRNIDPTDEIIRTSLQDKIKAQTEAAASLERAKGERDATKTRADGKEYETKTIGKAEAGVIKLKINAQSAGLKKIAQDLELDKNDRALLYMANMVEKMMESSNHSLVMGGPGDLGQSILAAANMMNGGLDKVKSGDTSGLDDIKQSIQGLDENDKQQLKALLEETPQVKKEE